MAPAVLAVIVMLLMLKRPGVIIWLGLIFCVLTILADTLLSFVKAGSLGSLAVGGDFKEDVPEGLARLCSSKWPRLVQELEGAGLFIFGPALTSATSRICCTTLHLKVCCKEAKESYGFRMTLLWRTIMSSDITSRHCFVIALMSRADDPLIMRIFTGWL